MKINARLHETWISKNNIAKLNNNNKRYLSSHMKMNRQISTYKFETDNALAKHRLLQKE